MQRYVLQVMQIHTYTYVATHYASGRIYNLYDFSLQEHSIHKHISTPLTPMLLACNVKFVNGFYFTCMRMYICAYQWVH